MSERRARQTDISTALSTLSLKADTLFFHRMTRRTILRLILLVLTRRPLVHPPLPQNTFDPSALLPGPTQNPASPSPPPVIISKDPVQDILLPKTLFVGSLTPGKELVRPLRSGREVAGESLWAARGLIYGQYHFKCLSRSHLY